MKRSLSSKIFDNSNSVFLILLCSSMLLPFVHIAAVSLSASNPVMMGQVSIWPVGFNVDTYMKILTDQWILYGYSNTILYTVVGTIINMLITSAGAYALAKKKMVFRRFFTFMITFTMMFSGGMIPSYLLVKNLHMIDTIWAVVLPGAVSTWNFLVMRQFFVEIPESLEEAAMIDGYNDIQIFFRIVIPLSKAALVTIALFYAVGHWNSFFGPLMYLQEKKKFPLQVILRSMIIENNLMLDASMPDERTMTAVQNIKYTVIMVASLPILCVYPFIQKYFVKGVMIGSIKG